MKKYLLIILLALFPTFVFADNTFVNSYKVEMTKSEYQNFVNMGFTEDEIENMTQEEYDYYKGYVYQDGSLQKKYFKETYVTLDSPLNKEPVILETIIEEVDENTYLNETSEMGKYKDLSNKQKEKLKLSVSPLASLNPAYETAYKRLEVSTSVLPGTKNTLITASLSWKQAPSVRSYDVFAIRSENYILNTDSKMAVSNTRYKTTYWNCDRPRDFTNKVNYNNLHSNWNVNKFGSISNKANGVGITFDRLDGDIIGCHDGDTGVPINLKPILSFRMSVSSTSLNSKTDEKIYVSYQHATKSLNLNDVRYKYEFTSGGLGNTINFTNGYNQYYDGMKGIQTAFLSQ